MNWFQVVFEAVRRRGPVPIIVWFTLMLVTWLAYSRREWSEQPLKPRELLGVGFAYAVLILLGAMVGTRLMAALRRRRSVRVAKAAPSKMESKP